MPETLYQARAGVYALLRRPSDIKLPPTDVDECLNDILKGRVQDMDLGGRDQRTEVAEVTIDEDDIDYLVRMPNVPDFEPVALEYGMTSAGSQIWREVVTVPYSTRARHYDGGAVAGSFYGSSGLQEGTKLWLNINPEELANLRFRLTYRLPLLNIVQSGEAPPIPTNHMPGVKREAAIKLMPQVQDDSPEWVAWMERTLPIYTAALQTDLERWRDYVESSVSPAIQPIRRFDSHRQRRRNNPRAYLPIQ
jgi:hypothetical protein